MATKNFCMMMIFALILMANLAFGFFIKDENAPNDEESERDMRATTEYSCFPWIFNPGKIETMHEIAMKKKILNFLKFQDATLILG